MKSQLDLHGKTAFITGGSGGLGSAIAESLALRGAHITLFSRRQGPLDQARAHLSSRCPDPEQEINAFAVDLGDAVQVDHAFRSQSRIPDLLYCTAGGNHAENGFFADIPAGALEGCMRNNYFSSAFAAKAALDIWLEDDKRGTRGREEEKKVRKIIFISSAAAFVCLPGSVAYSPDFVSPGFLAEQKTKTALTKRIQGLDAPPSELVSRFPTSEKVASLIIAAVDRGDFTICEDSPAASALFTAMTGPSPKRGWGIADGLLSIVVNWFVWPFLRWKWEGMVKDDAKTAGRGESSVT
ncbi:short chain dehydrogenase reductase [Lecanosticta acicola]|uniref:Short chain dehydrogenase reductase n=1 Tax=Lecanosticta acicola TaxID=111012 RepID=A0AAI8YSI0_9PEZI|nr:short chain dehydrogenase reductase [Lecanosticta acicola]